MLVIGRAGRPQPARPVFKGNMMLLRHVETNCQSPAEVEAWNVKKPAPPVEVARTDISAAAACKIYVDHRAYMRDYNWRRKGK